MPKHNAKIAFSMTTPYQNAGTIISKMAISKSYYHIRLGSKNKYVSECQASQFIGVDYGVEQDLSEQLPDTWQEFDIAC
jgi:hypothetical protein